MTPLGVTRITSCWPQEDPFSAFACCRTPSATVDTPEETPPCTLTSLLLAVLRVNDVAYDPTQASSDCKASLSRLRCCLPRKTPCLPTRCARWGPRSRPKGSTAPWRPLRLGSGVASIERFGASEPCPTERRKTSGWFPTVDFRPCPSFFRCNKPFSSMSIKTHRSGIQPVIALSANGVPRPVVGFWGGLSTELACLEVVSRSVTSERQQLPRPWGGSRAWSSSGAASWIG